MFCLDKHAIVSINTCLSRQNVSVPPNDKNVGTKMILLAAHANDSTRTRKHRTSAEQNETVSHCDYTGRLAEKVCSLSLFKSVAIWHIIVPKCRRKVPIIARLETPPLLLVVEETCRDRNWVKAVWLCSRLIRATLGQHKENHGSHGNRYEGE